MPLISSPENFNILIDFPRVFYLVTTHDLVDLSVLIVSVLFNQNIQRYRESDFVSYRVGARSL